MTIRGSSRAGDVAIHAAGRAATAPLTNRRTLLAGGAAAGGLLAWSPPSLAALFGGKNNLQAAFEKALKVQDDPVALEAAWTECLAIAPDNAAVWSNRGTARLALKRWKDAADDLQKARELEEVAYGYSSGFVLVALGNAKGAVGEWKEAIECYDAALEDPYPGIGALALASSALAKFELKQDAAAVAAANKALQEAPEFGDAQASLAGILWATGDKAGAQKMADAVGGKDVLATFVQAQQDANGWPPRTIAAVKAFVASEQSATAVDYNGNSQTYTFK